MTDLERGVADALRLSEKAAGNATLERQIKRNILVARSELIRTGVSDELANSGHPLIEEAIITFCLSKMDEETLQERHRNAFEYQVDNIRKSTITVNKAEESEVSNEK